MTTQFCKAGLVHGCFHKLHEKCDCKDTEAYRRRFRISYREIHGEDYEYGDEDGSADHAQMGHLQGFETEQRVKNAGFLSRFLVWVAVPAFLGFLLFSTLWASGVVE